MTDDGLYERVARILEQARGQVARTVNTAMVQAYWQVGRQIVEVEQAGEQRAGYGEEVIKRLSARLKSSFGKGFSVQNLGYMRQFYLAFPQGSSLPEIRQAPPGELREGAIHDALPGTFSAEETRRARPIRAAGGKALPGTFSAEETQRARPTRAAGSKARPAPPESPSISTPEPTRAAGSKARPAPPGNPELSQRFPPALGWTHYVILMRVANPPARAFYEVEAVREAWSTRQLERQIGAQLFERLARHRDSEEVRALALRGQEVVRPTDVIKDPFVLEFLDLGLGLGEHPALRERDVEQVILERLETFMLELGKGFCFVGRQKRLTVEGDHFHVDLVFYNRFLRCFVLIDLKLGKATHQDLGQMQMYVNHFDRAQRTKHEHKTIGIVLGSEQNSAMVNITLPEDNDQTIAAAYLKYLPSEAELQAELELARGEAERVLRLTAPPKTEGSKG